jgi:hypothetical protein
MCDPMSASLAVQGAGGVLGAAGAYNKSKADKAAYEYESKVTDNNALIADWQASDATTRGQVSEGRSRMKTAQLKGTQASSLAARGLDISEGSALNILQDTAYMGDLDAAVIKDNAAREAWGYRTDATNSRVKAAVLRARANAESPGRAAFNSLLGSAGQTAGNYGRGK